MDMTAWSSSGATRSRTAKYQSSVENPVNRETMQTMRAAEGAMTGKLALYSANG